MSEKQLTKIERLLMSWQKVQQPRQVDEDEPKIKIHQTISYLNRAYEQVRSFIDNRPGKQFDYWITSRILKRLLILENRKPETTPQILIEELIRAGYLKNNAVPKKDIKAVWQILDRYIILMDKIAIKIDQIVLNKDVTKSQGREMKKEINKWLVSLASREIERFLMPKNKEEILTKSMYEYMLEQIEIDDETISGQEKKVQIYLAVQRAFMKPGDDILNYYLFKLYYPNWSDCRENDLELIAKDIFKTKDKIRDQLNHSIKDKLKKICARHVVYFILLKEMLNNLGTNGFTKLLPDQQELDKATTEAINKSYKTARKKVYIEMIKSTLYVLITKYFVIEIPVNQGWEIAPMEHLIILLIGPVVMILVGLSIRKPSKKNTDKILQVFKRMIFQDKIRNIPYSIKHMVKRSFVKKTFFVLFYILLLVSIFFLIYFGFSWYDFNLMVISIILFFLSMISYFGFRLREIMREYIVLDKKENIVVFIFDFLSLPILKLGRLLNNFLKKINFTIPLCDYVLETPFKAFIRFFEGWTFFVVEKKEELDQDNN